MKYAANFQFPTITIMTLAFAAAGCTWLAGGRDKADDVAQCRDQSRGSAATAAAQTSVVRNENNAQLGSTSGNTIPIAGRLDGGMTDCLNARQGQTK